MKKRKMLAFFLFFVMVFTIVTPAFAITEQDETKTDWTVTGNETVQGKTLLIKGPLTIKSGATLQLLDATLLMDGSSGILAEQGAILTINNTKISSNNPGIIFYPIIIKCDNATIENSELTGLGITPGQYFNPLVLTGKGITVDNCIIGGAIALDRTSKCVISRNKLYQESTPAKFYSMIDLVESNENQITGNTEYGGLNGICCRYSWNNSFDSNTWFAQEEKYIGSSPEKWWNETYVNGPAAGNGIWLNEMSNNNMVTNNKAYGASCSAYRITQSSSNTLRGNYARGTRVGLVMLFAQNNIIDNNQFYDIWEYEAIQMYRTHDNYIINNTIKRSQIGVGLMSSKNETLSGNRFESCSKALNILNSNDNNILGNSSLNCISSLVVDWSIGNTISGNNFMTNKLAAFISKSNAVGGNIVKGNYWSGSTYAKDRALDSAFAKVPNLIEIATAPPIVPVEYLQRNIEDININSDTLWENKTIELKGTISVSASASLTMRNVTLIYKPDANAVNHSVIASWGGNISIYDSTFTGLEYDKFLELSIKNAESLIVKNSKFYNMGAWDGSGAIEIENVKNVDVQGNTFSGCYQAAKIWECSNVLFSGNTIEKSREGVTLSPITGSTVIIQNNKLNQIGYHGIRIWACMGQLSKASKISGNILTNLWGDEIWCSFGFLGSSLQKNSFTNVRGPSVISGDNLLLDGRSFRPIATGSSNIKKGQTINVYLTVMGVRRVLLKTTDSITTVRLTLNGKVISSKTLVIKSGKINTVSFSVKALSSGTYGLIFENERAYIRK